MDDYTNQKLAGDTVRKAVNHAHEFDVYHRQQVRDRWTRGLGRVLLVLVLLASLVYVLKAKADTGLSVICIDGTTVDGAPRSACTKTGYGIAVDDQLIRQKTSTVDVWRMASKLAATDTTEVCDDDIPYESVSDANGLPCRHWSFVLAGNRRAIYLSRTGRFSLNWTAPTQNTDGSALLDLAGYVIYSASDGAALGLLTRITSASTLVTVLSGYGNGVYQFAVAPFNVANVEGAKKVLTMRVQLDPKIPNAVDSFTIK